jgi:uncharacterized protein with GYD domain
MGKECPVDALYELCILSRAHYPPVVQPEGDSEVAKYLIEANYLGEGLKGLLKEGGSSRRQAVDKLLASVGGKVESFYYAFGDVDAYLVVDVPDNVAAAAIALTVGASGEVKVKTTVLMTPEEVDQATKKSPAYRAPGA